MTVPGTGRQRAIGILGMHRSGTSAIARAVNLLGPYIGPPEKMMEPAPENPEGFWEHMDIFSFDGRLLEFLSRSWDDVRPLPEGWWRRPELQVCREELRLIIAREFGGHPLWMWKDPRASVLLPLWGEVLRDVGIDVSYVICLRNPLDVAASLQRRDGFPKGKSLLLWLHHTLLSLEGTAGSRRVVVSYDGFLSDWKRNLKRIAAACDIPWPGNEDELDTAMAAFLRPALRHSHSSAESLYGDPEVPRQVASLYGMLRECENRAEMLTEECFLETIRGMRTDVSVLTEAVHSAVLDDRERCVASLEAVVKAREAHISDLEREARATHEYIVSLESARRLQEAHISDLEREARATHEYIVSLESARRLQEQHISDIEREARATHEYIVNLESARSLHEQHIGNLGNAVGSLEAAVREKDDSIQGLNHALAERERVIRDINASFPGRVLRLWKRLRGAL